MISFSRVFGLQRRHLATAFGSVRRVEPPALQVHPNNGKGQLSRDLFLLDTGCHLNSSIQRAFERSGFGVQVATDFQGVPDDVLRQAQGYRAVCIFVNRKIEARQVSILKENGNALVLCCSAGFDNVPVEVCKTEGIRVGRVPSYSPSSVAEYAIASLFALAKNIQKSYESTKEANFTIADLMGMLLEDKSVGILGTGLIGKKTCEKLSGLVKKIYCYDEYPAYDWIRGVPRADYVSLNELLARSDMISIHIPLTAGTHHLINQAAIEKMKPNVILVNTSRGEIVDTDDLLAGLRCGRIGGAALDVFEGEKALMYKNMKERGYDNPQIRELADMHNVILSSHVAFYTDESVNQITKKTLENYKGFLRAMELDESAFVA